MAVAPVMPEPGFVGCEEMGKFCCAKLGFCELCTCGELVVDREPAGT